MKKIIALDAGHGIETPGKRSFDGRLREYEFNRNIVARMKPILEKEGYEVVVTCQTAYDVALPTRCGIANRAKADIFVSIHANAAGNSWNIATGWEVLIPETGGKSEQLAKCFEVESKDLGLKNRGIKVRDDLYVLNGTIMPAILVEQGFMTNKEECLKLLSGSYRQKAAEANCRAIVNYFKQRGEK